MLDRPTASPSLLVAEPTQWKTRPADVLGHDLPTLYDHARTYDGSTTRVRLRLAYASIGLTTTGAPILLSDEIEGSVHFTHHGFTAFCRELGLPVAFLRSLPPGLLAGSLNHAIRTSRPDVVTVLLGVAPDGRSIVRGTAREGFVPTKDATLLELLLELRERRPDWALSRGRHLERETYLADAGLALFFVDADAPARSGLTGDLARGFHVTNSEVGDGSCTFRAHWHQYGCALHWLYMGSRAPSVCFRFEPADSIQRNAERLAKALDSFRTLRSGWELHYFDLARDCWLGWTREAVVEAVHSARVRDLSLEVLKEAAELSFAPDTNDGASGSLWTFASGILTIARDKPTARERLKLERAAGNLGSFFFP